MRHLIKEQLEDAKKEKYFRGFLNHLYKTTLNVEWSQLDDDGNEVHCFKPTEEQIVGVYFVYHSYQGSRLMMYPISTCDLGTEKVNIDYSNISYNSHFAGSGDAATDHGNLEKIERIMDYFSIKKIEVGFPMPVQNVEETINHKDTILLIVKDEIKVGKLRPILDIIF
jgi:hypothetical protein